MRTWKNGILLPFLLVLLWYIISKGSVTTNG